ncbi:MAG: lamin tail domain-containing protein [Ruminococcus sp.]
MKKAHSKISSRITASVMALTISLSGAATSAVYAADADSVNGTPLIFTEIVPDTDNVSGADAYEYLEIFNSSNSDIKLSDYEIHYSYTNSDTLWTPDQSDLTVCAGESIVLWVLNGSNNELTQADFNSYYGTELVMGENLGTIQCGGLHNSKARSLEIRTQLGEVLCHIEYNDGDVKNVKLNKGITFAYENGNVNETRLGYETDANPSVVEDNQKPSEMFSFTNPSDLSAELNCTDKVLFGESFKPSLTVSGSNRALKAELVIAFENGEKSYLFTKTESGINAEISYSELANLKSFSCYASVYDGVTTYTTDKKDVTVFAEGELENNISPLVVTEILPDSSNINGSDAYEFIEIYNNSDEDIDFSDYKIYYNYPDSSTDALWESTPSEVVIPAGKTLVFWIKNGKNDSLTVDDFNAKFNTNLVMNESLVEIYSAGMANSGARGVKITSNVKDELNYVLYNKGGADDTTADKSIKYKLDVYTGEMNMVSNASEPTPGTVTEDEKPDMTAKTVKPENPPVLTDNTPDSFDGVSDLRFSLTAQPDKLSVKTVELYIKDNTMQDFERYNLLRENGDEFGKDVLSVDLTGKKSYTYYFTVSDGVNKASTEEKTIFSTNLSEENLTLNLAENQQISGDTLVIGSSENGSEIKLSIDGNDVTEMTKPSLSKDAMFVFEVSQTDTFFKNAVAIGSDVIGIFDDGTYDSWQTIAYPISTSCFTKGEPLTISIHAGNKANPLEHNEENNDDFVVKNIRLILPNGLTLRTEKYSSPDAEIKMGDSTGKIEILDAEFNAPDSAYTGISYSWNTAETNDGQHTVSVSDGTETKTVNVNVDNTRPEITTNIEPKQYKGNNEITASAVDNGSGISEFTATLDGEKINLPYSFSSTTLTEGEHTLVLTATDIVGNKADKTVVFTTPKENPEKTVNLSDNGAENPTLTATVNDPTNDIMTVVFKKGDSFSTANGEISVKSGVSDASGKEPESYNSETTVTTLNGYPTLTYELETNGVSKTDDVIGVSWNGTSDENAKISLYAQNADGDWDKITSVKADENGNLTISSEFDGEKYLNNGKLRLMVQNGEGYTPTSYEAGTPANPTENKEITTENAEDLDRNLYDFTFAVESDTQYYNENLTDIYRHQVNIHDWIIANRPRMNIQYLFHNGDIIDDFDQLYEWENADAAYKKLDDANFPYGVLAGNHDVSHKDENYSNYCTYFGEDRYSSNPWYGGSYKDNKGHYDLISSGGIDFIMVYMGWGIYDEEIEWMNDVLAQYPERKAILNFHEYLLTTKGFGEQPQRIYDEVVAKNPNVCMVLSGHYHSAATRVDQFDDDGDGVNDRSVYQMLFDYQSLAEGGRGFMRLMHFSLENQKITVKTYSPSENSYHSGAMDDSLECFEIPFAELGIESKQKTLSSDNLSVNLYHSDVISEINGVESGSTVNAVWNRTDGETGGWYVEASDDFGGISRSEIAYTSQPAIKGDVNGDGVVNVADATEIQKYLAELVELSESQKNSADVNGDGVISIFDATEIQMIAAEVKC